MLHGKCEVPELGAWVWLDCCRKEAVANDQWPLWTPFHTYNSCFSHPTVYCQWLPIHLFISLLCFSQDPADMIYWSLLYTTLSQPCPIIISFGYNGCHSPWTMVHIQPSPCLDLSSSALCPCSAPFSASKIIPHSSIHLKCVPCLISRLKGTVTSEYVYCPVILV